MAKNSIQETLLELGRDCRRDGYNSPAVDKPIYVRYLAHGALNSSASPGLGGTMYRQGRLFSFLMGAIAFTVLTIAVPAHAQIQELKAGKTEASASFPCKAERQKTIKTETDAGTISIMQLRCTKNNTVFLLGISVYPEEIVKALSREEMLDSTLDDARSKKYIKIASSKQLSHAGLPAIRSHILDTRQPETATISLTILTGNTLVLALVISTPKLIDSNEAKEFLNSLKTKE